MRRRFGAVTLLAGLAIAGAVMAPASATAVSKDPCARDVRCAFNATTALWKFWPSVTDMPVERTIWLRKGTYETQMFVDRWRTRLRSDWAEGAKRSSIRRLRVPADGDYKWRNVAQYFTVACSSHSCDGLDLAKLLPRRIGLNSSLTPTNKSIRWTWKTDYAKNPHPSWGTTSGTGTYHFGSWLRRIGP